MGAAPVAHLSHGRLDLIRGVISITGLDEAVPISSTVEQAIEGLA